MGKKSINNELSLLIAIALGNRPTEFDGVDWLKFNALAEWHGMEPLVFRALQHGIVPESIISGWRAKYDKRNLINLYQTSELIKIASELEKNDIDSYSYKGRLWAKWLLGDENLRLPGDIDLLIPKQHLPRAIEKLMAIGYEVDPYHAYLVRKGGQVEKAFWRTDYHIPMFKWSPDGSMIGSVELHWRLAYPRLCLDFPDDEWPKFSARYLLIKASVLSFVQEYQFLILIANHGTKERWSHLRFVADLAAYMQHFGATTNWPIVMEMARRKGLEKATEQAFALLRTLGMSWNQDFPPPASTIGATKWLCKWGTMRRKNSNHTYQYFVNALKDREKPWSLRILQAHLVYLTEWRLLASKARWYLRH